MNDWSVDSIMRDSIAWSLSYLVPFLHLWPVATTHRQQIKSGMKRELRSKALRKYTPYRSMNRRIRRRS